MLAISTNILYKESWISDTFHSPYSLYSTSPFPWTLIPNPSSFSTEFTPVSAKITSEILIKHYVKSRAKKDKLQMLNGS